MAFFSFYFIRWLAVPGHWRRCGAPVWSTIVLLCLDNCCMLLLAGPAVFQCLYDDDDVETFFIFFYFFLVDFLSHFHCHIGLSSYVF
jgi:hypothetical protein